MIFVRIKAGAKWYALVSSVLFVTVSTFIRVKYIFESGFIEGVLLYSSLGLAIITLLFGLLALPKWQSWVSLAIFCYAVYWICFTTPYVIGHWEKP
jgi:hypothetical protein